MPSINSPICPFICSPAHPPLSASVSYLRAGQFGLCEHQGGGVDCVSQLLLHQLVGLGRLTDSGQGQSRKWSEKKKKSTIMVALACWYVPASEFTFFYCLLLYCLFLKYNRSIFYCALKLFVTHLSWIEIPFTNISPHLRQVYKCN